MNGYSGSCGPDNSEIHYPIQVVSEQPGTIAVEPNVTSDKASLEV
jgi:hypothetical protein